VGDYADGQVGAALAYGWVRLDTRSQYVIRPGFSGGGLWSPDYGAVVGIVGQAHANGDGRAVTLYQAHLDLPDLKLATLSQWSAESAGEVALAQWGWALDRDPEGVRHWRPRARGVSVNSERGWRFRGRAAALERITSWLGRTKPDRRVLVVTGSPGAGKSAVLGRVVTTADAAVRSALLAEVPTDEAGILAAVGSVGCAVHAKGKSALEVAEEIARAVSAPLPTEPWDLAPAVREALEWRPGSRFNVIIDALDESAGPDQARAVIDSVVLPLAETCADAGVQVAVGTRRRDDDGDLLDRFGPALDLVDLDNSQYFAHDDLAAYALACLRLVGDERPGNPYANDGLAMPMAARIAEVANKNFLIAGLISRTHGLHDSQPAGLASVGSEATVRTALAGYLNRLSPVDGVSAASVLTALAFAEGPGLPVELWQLAVQVLYRERVNARDLARFARSAAANFLVETTGEAQSNLQDPGPIPIYRLFHQALNDALLLERVDAVPRLVDERLLTRAFIAHGRAADWCNVPDYLLRSLPGHAQVAGQLDDLLTDDAYLLRADLRRMIQAADAASAPVARQRARLLRLTPQAITAAPASRAAMFSVIEALENLGTTYRDTQWHAPYHAVWAATQPRRERITFLGHQGGVHAVCAITVDGRDFLASGSEDGTVRVWDPRTGEQTATLEGHQDEVNAVCAVTVDERNLLASGGSDGTIRVWDPRTGEPTATLEGHQDEVYAVCAVIVGERNLIVSGSHDGTVRVWDPRTGEPTATLQGHQGEVNALCPVTVDERNLLASGGSDGTIRVWDPRTREQTAMLEGHHGGVNAVCAVTVDERNLLASGGNDRRLRLWDLQRSKHYAALEGRQSRAYALCAVTVDERNLLASGGSDGTIRVWDPRTGEQTATFQGHQDGVHTICAVTVDERNLLASGGDDRRLRLWEIQRGEQYDELERHPSGTYAVCAVTVDGRDLLASGSDDGTVRVWDPRTGEPTATFQGHQGGVQAVCGFSVDGRDLLVSGGDDRRLLLWDVQRGEQYAALEGHRGWVGSLCAVNVDGRDLLASGGFDGTVRVWDPRTGEQYVELHGHQNPIYTVCVVRIDGQDLLASGGIGGTVRVWDPRTGEQTASLEGDQGWVGSVCAVNVDGRDLLASGGDDGIVRLWDPSTGAQTAAFPGHQGEVYAVCAVTVGERSLLASGSSDGTVRLWNVRAGTCAETVPTHHQALAVAPVANSLAIGFTTGILVIRPNSMA
jgi:WD40 repeat protein